MNRHEILLRTQNDIVNFVNKIAQYPFSADLRCGSHVVDAKSLLGVLGFGMGKTLTLQVYGEDNGRLMSDISEYLVTGK